ncbi:cupin domain-containing protein [Halovenus sp. WSH3]|uniref:Cupin domain-containing protein n=1 Tax=Halovenus carboxidivorans TaxID=2692199 RepID=A0A6B0T2Q8_9EURY|nr:cupin domain-containing protein [Halovenus carboxidivorans]MXR50526.1 cupin domain-containing protein [Halovenus carboxidivorans]
MNTVDLDDLDPQSNPMNSDSVADALDAAEFAMNYYVLEPGEEFTGGLHAHLDQEEAFVVLEGEATFEVQESPTADSETVTVGEEEMIRFPAGEYQQGRNESDDVVRALALGAPQESSDIRVAAPCQACGDSDYLEFVATEAGAMVECPECGESFEA